MLKTCTRYLENGQNIHDNKPGRPRNAVTSFRNISLLLIISKLFEKLLRKRPEPIIEDKNIIPPHQFGFGNRNLTVDQAHRINDMFKEAYEKKLFSQIFRYISSLWQGLAR